MILKLVKPQATLLGYSKPVDSDNPEKIVAASAKLCYSNSNASTLLNNLDDDKTQNFLERLGTYNHQSPIEHISFTFGIEGISRSCSHQLVRHRLASYSQQSQRYVDLSANDQIGVVMPPEFEASEDLKAQYLNDVERELYSYDNALENLYQHYLDQTDGKITTKEANALRKKALEDARYLLPNACETKLVMTMNARSLLNFFGQRCCNRAQWEIRTLADQMVDVVTPIAPTIFESAGAPCLNGPCPEGKMTCGNPKVKTKRRP